MNTFRNPRTGEITSEWEILPAWMTTVDTVEQINDEGSVICTNKKIVSQKGA